MKTLSLFLCLTTFSIASASSQYSRVCSNSNATVSVSTSQGYGNDSTKVSILRSSLGGSVNVELSGEDLEITEEVLATFKNEAKNVEAYCGKTYLVTSKVYAVKINLKKKDGSVFVEDDTPATDNDKVINDYLICSEKSVGAWPCN